MINPLNHTLSLEKVNVYKAEPYAVAADVYGEQPLTGQAGWTWYTGSAGWMYRVALESILGFTLEKDAILLNPSVSSDWPDYQIRYLADQKGTVYLITIENPENLETGILTGTADGKKLKNDTGPLKIYLEQDGREHDIRLRLIPIEEKQKSSS
jgi:cellobiose phosphorylase